MQRDAHYYATMAFCRACGFKKESAHIVGYAAQFVDEARINLLFIEDTNLPIVHEQVEKKPAFFNMATCHSYFKIKTFNFEAMVNNTCAFHFVPGCEGKSFTKKLRCKEQSPVIMDILKDTLLDKDLIKLGIVFHVYVDTFSHQGFSGMLSKVNDIKNCKAKGKVYVSLKERGKHILKNRISKWNQEKFDSIFDHIMPAYGHSQALDYPDFPYLTWSYEYDCSDEFNGVYKLIIIDNKDRYQRAFRSMIDNLKSFLAKNPQHLDENIKFQNFEVLLQAFLYKGTKEKREENWRKVMVDQGLFSKRDVQYIFYEENKWLKEAFRNFDPEVFNNRRVEGAQLAEDFCSSNWYGFYLAVKWYKKRFFHYCSKYGLSIPN